MYPLKADKLFVLNFLFCLFHTNIQSGRRLQIHVLLLLADIHVNLNVMFFFSGLLVSCLYTFASCIYLQILNKAILDFLSPPQFCLSIPLLFLLFTLLPFHCSATFSFSFCLILAVSQCLSALSFPPFLS